MKYVHFLIFFILLSLTFFAPSKYSYSYCLLIVSIFAIQNFFLFSRREYKDIASFEFFFAFSFFICNFVYPIFYYPINPYIDLFGALNFNEEVINYSTALSSLGYSSIVIGILSYRVKPEYEYKLSYINSKMLLALWLISLLSFSGFILFGGFQHLIAVYKQGDVNIAETSAFSYFNIIFNISMMLLAMFVLKVRSKFFRKFLLVYIFLISVIMLFTGSRTLVLGLGLILVVSYSINVKQISKIKLISIMTIGTLLMSSIMLYRSNRSLSSLTLKSDNASFLDMFMELIATNRNLYVLVDFSNNNFNTFFLTALADLASPIPGLTRYIESFRFPIDMMGGGFTTYLEFGPGSNFGLGTNMIGEMYLAFGLFGVIIISYIIGLIISKSKNNLNNIYFYIIYFLFVSHAIFYPRAFYMFNPRIIIWSIILIWILNKIFVIRAKS